ncbi:hypothetical protein [Bacteroides acidifaciens]|uniref:hypothetical protein n=1 Tax=Bacteroides acidifaciens TaxID=85831 RepID=UPI002431E148|nr:hypothetical protein [Bacteroides acidifaciens]
MKRVRTKIGAVFSAKVSENEKKYFQLIAFDLTQLNSDVIRAFKKVYGIEEQPPLAEIVNGEVEFYAHCVTKSGVKLSLWEKVGSIPEVGDIKHIIFRGTSDAARKEGDPFLEVSHKWYVWHIGDDDFKDVGKLRGKNREAEIGMVINPYSIVHRIKTGKYNFYYPGFE